MTSFRSTSLAFVAVLLSFHSIGFAGMVTFGSGSNSFSMEFVRIGTPGNTADTTGVPNPAGRVVNRNDFDTCILFGDAASATILSNDAECFFKRNHPPQAAALTRLLRRPLLSAAADSSSALRVPFYRSWIWQNAG